MKCLITGASSGIGRDMALYMSSLGYDLYVVARNGKNLEKTFKDVKTKIIPIELDLSVIDNCYKLYNDLKKEKIDILINNAGFGDAGNFTETSLEKELNMIDVNIKAYHILTKLFLQDMVKKDRGHILNVASMAGFMPGPYMATYYATKAYILNLSIAINEELKQSNSNVKISVLCPGPVKTNFNKVANVKFSIGSISSEKAAREAIEGMFNNKLIIIPSAMMKLNKVVARLFPLKLVTYINSKIQRRKI